MKVTNVHRYYLKRKMEITGALGSVMEGYSEIPEEILAYIYPATGQVQVQQYGQRLGYVLNMLYQDYQISERDGVCVCAKSTEPPDYRVVSVKRYSNHYEAELERVQ